MFFIHRKDEPHLPYKGCAKATIYRVVCDARKTKYYFSKRIAEANVYCSPLPGRGVRGEVFILTCQVNPAKPDRLR
jgi:hypothetical protein